MYTFQLEFNAIDLELRVSDKTKAKLDQRAEDTQQVHTLTLLLTLNSAPWTLTLHPDPAL